MVMVSRSVVQKVSNLVFCARWTSAVISGRILRVNRPISYHSYNVQARSRVPGEIKRREVELDPQVIPEKIMSREVKLGCESCTSFGSGCCSTAVQRTLSLWLCPSTAVDTAIAQCTSRCAMARGHLLNTFIVPAAVHGLRFFSRRYPRSSLHSFAFPCFYIFFVIFLFYSVSVHHFSGY